MEEHTNRRGSLAISALLNDEPVDLSPIISSGTLSPVMGGGSRSQLTKAKRKRISPGQYNRLIEIFDQTDTPSSEIRENLAEELDMTKREVQVWFQNRRAKMNRTKNLNTRHRHSLIPAVSTHPYHVKPRRASAYPVLENHYYKQQTVIGPYPCPIAPMPIFAPPPPPPPLPPSSAPRHERKPSAIDLLASAAEYVRTDRKEFRT
ncbi:hypothetical protein INT47_010435 [Mucor saturninus]|uniref:Homeobox domain-containing protein n=1 Tax=Mucor saturninus TaxID=64648 RepID=A0A8H7V993_9FUNG|nr:hypothetical protein INT47_010435 [Mucor saturninus]